MVLFSTYRSSRLVAPGFLKGPIMRWRAQTDYFGRPWNGTFMFFIPGDATIWAIAIPLIYGIHRWHNDHTLESDNYEQTMIERWGGSVEEVRKNLSAQDQVRVRGFADMEKLFSAYGPKDAYIRPDGSTLPGPAHHH